MTEGNGPARIDRAALERIIQRAAELQTAEHEIGDSMTSDELMALGREVGIPGRYLQQAHAGGAHPAGTVGAPGRRVERVAGPGQITAQRVVPGDPDAIEQSLLRWIEQQRAALRAAAAARAHHLGTDRRHSGRHPPFHRSARLGQTAVHAVPC